jgi:hypothetical protein
VRQLPAVTLRSDLGPEVGAFRRSQMSRDSAQTRPRTAVRNKPRQGPRLSIRSAALSGLAILMRTHVPGRPEPRWQTPPMVSARLPRRGE